MACRNTSDRSIARWLILKFAIIAEGPCDQVVIENILIGYFRSDDGEPTVNYVQPPQATTADPSPPGGWTRVFQSLRNGDPQKALQFHDYLVIHIDTDVQEEAGFDVPRRDGRKVFSVPERVAHVRDRLIRDIDPVFYQNYGTRILFAITVDSIECWLLPLLSNNDAKAKKITGCYNAVNAELRRTGRPLLSTKETHHPPHYELASRDFTDLHRVC